MIQITLTDSYPRSSSKNIGKYSANPMVPILKMANKNSIARTSNAYGTVNPQTPYNQKDKVSALALYQQGA